MVNFGILEVLPRPSEEEWEAAKKRFPLGARATGRVIGLQPFGAFLDLGLGVLGLMEMPGFPDLAGDGQVVYPDVGSALEGLVIRHRELNRQIEIVSENPWSDLFQQRAAWAASLGVADRDRPSG